MDSNEQPSVNERIRGLLKTHIPIRIDNDHVKWYPRSSLAAKMKDDFEDRHVATISEDDE